MGESYTPRGRYFEEFEVGYTMVTAGRTVTETDVVNFAGISGDFTQIHTNAEYARDHLYGQRIGHGLLGLSICSGLLVQSGLIEGTILAFRDLTWKFSLPVIIGDTLHARAVVEEVKPLPRMSGGAVILAIEVINQDGKIIQSGKWMALVQSKPES